MPVLINPQDNAAVNVPPEQFQQYIGQGWLVPLNDSKGNPVAAPYQEANKLISEGFSQPNDAELSDLLNQAKYSSGPQKAGAFAEGVAAGLTGPAYSAIAPLTGLTTREDIKNREEYNPGLSTAGEITGTVGGALTGTGLPGMIGKAGRAASVLGKVAGKAGQIAAKGAAEAALYTAADQINERLLGDPEALSESLMGHVGMSALLGAGAGLALAPVGTAINKAGKLGQKTAERIANNDKIIGKVADKIYDTATDLGLPGIARPAARLAKKAVVNSVLAIAPEKQTVMNQILHLGEMAQKAANAIDKNAAGIFASEIEKRSGFVRPEDETAPEKLHGLGLMVMDHATDPQKLIDKMNDSTMVMANSAPDISMALTANVARAVSFLASKVPQPQKENLLDTTPEPSRTEIQKFNRYAQVVEDPISVLKKLRDATVLPQDLEALSAVYPALYSTMKTSVLDKLIGKMGKQKSINLPYNKRMSLSLFLGMPLDSSMKAQSIMSNQQAFGTMQIQRSQQAAMQQVSRASKTGMGKMDPMRDLTRGQRALTRR